MTLPDQLPEPPGPAPLPFALPDITEAEISAVVDVLKSKWITTGSKTRTFEERFAKAVGAPHAVALNSCTAALHLSLEALGVGPGDLVFVPTYTFAATAEVVRYVGAQLVLVDVERDSLNMDPEALEHAVASASKSSAMRPAVVIPVHFSGVAARMQEIWDIARRHDLAVVEDAAHAFPSMHDEYPVGWSPDDVRGTTCFSFYATKTITTGEGGMMTTRDSAIADRVRTMSLHGLTSQAWNRYSGGSWRYDIVAPGYKYNLTDIAAALGLVQLSRAQSMADRRREIADAYSVAFAKLDSLEIPIVPDDRVSSWHLYTLRLAAPLGEADRDRMIEKLRLRGIATSMHFIPLHLHSWYRETYGYRPSAFPVALDVHRRTMSLPIYSSMTDADVNRVIDEVLDLGGELK